MKSQVLTYSRSPGLFAGGTDLNGAALTQDEDETHILYGRFVPFDQILEGKAPRTSKGRAFVATLEHYTGPNSSQQKPSAAKEQRGTLTSRENVEHAGTSWRGD